MLNLMRRHYFWSMQRILKVFLSFKNSNQAVQQRPAQPFYFAWPWIQNNLSFWQIDRFDCLWTFETLPIWSKTPCFPCQTDVSCSKPRFQTGDQAFRIPSGTNPLCAGRVSILLADWFFQERSHPWYINSFKTVTMECDCAVLGKDKSWHFLVEEIFSFPALLKKMFFKDSKDPHPIGIPKDTLARVIDTPFCCCCSYLDLFSLPPLFLSLCSFCVFTFVCVCCFFLKCF